jgi:hypothetical protein
MAVSFSGANKLITCTSGTTSLDIRKDAYSRWKDWMLTDDNSKYLAAFSTLGGDEIATGEFVGDFYFLENGWKIKPQEASHVLSVVGNIFSRDGSNPYNSTTGTYNVTIKTKYAALTNQIISAGATIDLNLDAVADAVWDEALSTHTTTGTAGKALADSGGGEAGGLTEDEHNQLMKLKNPSAIVDGEYII